MRQQRFINNSNQVNIMFRGIIFPPSEALDCVTACGIMAPTMLPAGSLEAEALPLRFQATGRQHRGCIIPQAVTHSLVLLKMGK